jgi:hypothetical protein
VERERQWREEESPWRESRERAHHSLRSLGSEWIFSFLRFVCKQFPFLWNGREGSIVPNDISHFLSSGITSSKIPVTFLQSKRDLTWNSFNPKKQERTRLIPAKYSIQTASSMQSIKTLLKLYLEVCKKFETIHTNSASIDVHCHKIWVSNSFCENSQNEFETQIYEFLQNKFETQILWQCTSSDALFVCIFLFFWKLVSMVLQRVFIIAPKIWFALNILPPIPPCLWTEHQREVWWPGGWGNLFFAKTSYLTSLLLCSPIN